MGQRLRRRLIPAADLNATGPYDAELDEAALLEFVASDFGRFLAARAELVKDAMMKLCDGGTLG